MKKYILEIEFKNKKYGKHCLDCPVRNSETDGCIMQKINENEIDFENWEKQMDNCPLKLISS